MYFLLIEPLVLPQIVLFTYCLHQTIILHSLQENLQVDEDVQASSEADILTQYQKDAQSFAEPQTTVLG